MQDAPISILEQFSQMKDTFEQWEGSVGDFFEQVEKSHGRIETRRCRSVTDSEWQKEWQRVKSVTT